MYQVAFPNVIETFHRALEEVLGPFLSTGNLATLMGHPVMFYKCDLLFSNDVFLASTTPRPNPFICFVGERTGSRETMKCLDPRGDRPYGYEVRQQISRTVFVGIGRGLELLMPPYEEPNPRMVLMRDAENIWSQLLIVMEHQWKAFNDRGIYKPTIPAIPAQINNHDYLLLTGQLTAEVRFTMTRGN